MSKSKTTLNKSKTTRTSKTTTKRKPTKKAQKHFVFSNRLKAALVVVLVAIVGYVTVVGVGAESSLLGRKDPPTGRVLHILQANVFSANDKLNTPNPAPFYTVAKQAATQPIDIMMLQEVCTSQLGSLMSQLPAGWKYTFTAEVPRKATCPGVQPDDSGIMVLSKYPILSQTVTDLNTPQVTNGHTYKMLCATVDMRSVGVPKPVIGCTTHLIASGGAERLNDPIRMTQTRRIHDTLRPLMSSNYVVLTGDFNTVPWNDEMSLIYRVSLSNGSLTNSKGDFYEADQLDRSGFTVVPRSAPRNLCGTEVCRSGPYTHHRGIRFGQPSTELYQKIDYVFFSVNSVASPLPMKNSANQLNAQIIPAIAPNGVPTSDHDVIHASVALPK
jgi:endonuclease/exonuclease/phosphatase family metal-dependent hydrolase